MACNISTNREVTVYPSSRLQRGMADEAMRMYAELRRIARGPREGEKQLVAWGLKPGETIVADGVHKVRLGDKVVSERQRD